MSTPRSEHMPIGYSANAESPTGNTPLADPPTSAGSLRSSFGLNPANKMAGASRSGADSPSHEMAGASRIYSKRAREIQAQEGVPGLPVNLWGGPPTSGNSTPLRENIPESPTDGFPDFDQALPAQDSLPQTRRARAGTVPSRFSPGGAAGGPLSMLPLNTKTASKPAPAPSPSPFKAQTHPPDPADSTSGSSTLLSRLRAGSMPQRSPFMAPASASPFGPSIFTNWNPAGTGRERGSTLASIASLGSNGPSSPAQSAFSKEGGGDSDVHMRTLDYLGLAETPQQPRAQLATPYMANANNDFFKASRFRSYSVNNKDKYADEDEDDYDEAGMPYDVGMLNLQDQIAATQAAIHNHNLAVQAFHRHTMTRPRARTAGVLDTPGSRLMGTYLPGNPQIPTGLGTTDAHLGDEKEYEDLPQAVASMNLARSSSRNAGLLNPDEAGLEGPTSALWLGSIPTSTTISTLQEMFKSYGNIVSARVLTHKNCGFVNFERLESAVSARANLNGKEIFPGAGPVRINFAKPPSSATTPGHDGVYPSPSPDPFATTQQDGAAQGAASAATPTEKAVSPFQATTTVPTVAPLNQMTDGILEIVKQFGASDEDRARVSQSLQSAVRFTSFVDEIPPIREPAHTRVHDAPKLRDIRKRIDNQSFSQDEIESIAVEMLPEIAELASDYLGNTVVQKLFEHCSDQHRDAMLAEIAPHMAEIGVHKNGTWAAQKIIDVCKTPHQMSLIVEYLRPYTMPLFLDQYGNYVLQGCLKFGAPYNDFIFETMLSRMWEVAQGRYGARAMRACLESHHATKDQQRMLAAAIALHSVQLATNANGALLLTWFLDTCTFPQRRTVLSPHLVPYLVHLCTHKVAYLTVLKVINQKAEAEARDTMLKALFFTPNDQILEAILSDHACGATLIFKVITTPFFDDSLRGQIVETAKTVLLRIKAQPSQGYKRLMDEVGLSTRSGGGNRDHASGNNGSNGINGGSNNNNDNNNNNNSGEPRQRPASRQANAGNHQQAHGNKQFYSNPVPQSGNASTFDVYTAPRSDAMDPSMTPFQSYGGPQTPMYSSPGTPVPNIQQYYQLTLMNRGLPPVNNFFPPQMQAGFGGGYNSSSPSVEQFRLQNMANGSPIQAPVSQMPPQMPGAQGFGPPPGFGMGMNMGGPPYGGNVPGTQNMGFVQQDQGNRRGRR